MERSQQVFDYIKKKLIEWKPKTTPYGQGGIGFDDNTVLDISETTLPSKTPFDFVTVELPTKSENLGTVAQDKVTSSRQTFPVNVYCKRVGTDITAKRATKTALIENVEKLIEIMSFAGFSNTTPIYDLAYAGNGTGRAMIYFTREFRLNSQKK